MERAILTKFGTMMCLGPADTSSQQKFTISKIQDGSCRNLEKSKNLNNFASDWPVLIKFGMRMRLATQDPIVNKISRFQKSKMAVAAILKICKIAISPQPIDLFWWNLASWYVWTLSTTIANKISRFQKSTTAAAAILKICKIAISPQWNDQFWWNLVEWCVWTLRTLSANKILWIRQSKMAAAAILKNRKNVNNRPFWKF